MDEDAAAQQQPNSQAEATPLQQHNSDAEGGPEVELTSEHVNKYVIGRSFEVPRDTKNSYINAMSYSKCGKIIVCAWNNPNSTLVAYDAIHGSQLNSFDKGVQGVERLTFLHNRDAIAMASKSVYAGSKVVTLYNIKTKQDICLYRMHSDKITALKTHPNKDYIMSASKDKEICLWDVNRQGKQAAARLNLEDATHPSIAFDPKGVCFAVGATVKKKTFIQLFDMRKIGDGCFDKFEVDSNGNLRGWHNIQFSPDGKQMLLTPHQIIKGGGKVADSNVPHYLIDSFTGKLLVSLTDHCVELDAERRKQRLIDGIEVPGYQGPMYASFSPDSKFIVSGDLNSSIRVWSTKENALGESFELVSVWSSGVSMQHKVPVGPVLWNPRYDSVACASLKLSLWQRYGGFI